MISMFWHDSPHNVLAELVALVAFPVELNTIMLLGDGLAPGAVAFRVVFALLSGVLKAEPESMFQPISCPKSGAKILAVQSCSNPSIKRLFL